MVAAGSFREDLFYRLGGVELRVPPLRARKEEIPLLADTFRSAFEDAGAPAAGRRFSAAALDAMFRYDWPGNVRELENVVKRALVLARGRYVEPEDLDLDFERTVPRIDETSVVPAPTVPEGGGRVLADPRDQRTASTLGRAEAGRGLAVRAVRWQRLAAFFADASAARDGLSPHGYCELVGASRRTASRDLALWLREGRLCCHGVRRSLRYFLATGQAGKNC